MAEVMENFPIPHGKRGVTKYAEWLDGQIWRINWREDMESKSIEGARGSLHSAANLLDLRVRTRADGDDHIIIQSYKEETRSDVDVKDT